MHLSDVTDHHRNIQRHSGRFCGWTVRITRRAKLEVLQFFSDKRFGGAKRALKAAVRYRDEQLLALYPPVRIRRFYPRNNTGEIGVTLERRRIAGRIYPRYVAVWPTGRRPGEEARRSYSVMRHGVVQAFAMAVDARRSGVEALVRKTRRELAKQIRRRQASPRGPAARGRSRTRVRANDE